MSERGAGFLTVAVAGLAEAQRELSATDIFIGDVIHDASDGVGAVDGRGAVTQDFNALEAAVGQRVDVGRERRSAGFRLADRMRREPTTVEEDERIARGNTTERDAGVVTASGGAEGRGFVAGQAGDLRERSQQFGGLRGIAHFEFAGGQHGHGQDFFLIEAFDVGTGDGESLELDGLIDRLSGGREGQHGARQQGETDFWA